MPPVPITLGRSLVPLGYISSCQPTFPRTIRQLGTIPNFTAPTGRWQHSITKIFNQNQRLPIREFRLPTLASYRCISDKQMAKGKLPPKHFMSGENKHKAIPSEVTKVELDESSHWLSEVQSNLPHPVWSERAVRSVQRIHFSPTNWSDKFAYGGVRLCRLGYDVASGYQFGRMNEKMWINRIIFLETVAGVPGLVGAMVRHLKSLRRMERDYGWIHTLLEEAENERMHLMTAIQIKKPGPIFRFLVLGAQAIFLPAFTVAYMCSSKFAHRFVGYLEEEAVKTYTHLLEELEAKKWKGFAELNAPLMARQYWELAENASFKDMIYAIRADESHHRDVNHTFASMKPDDPNPFAPGH